MTTDEVRLLPARHVGQSAAPHHTHHEHTIAGHSRPPHLAPARPRPRAAHVHSHRRTWKPPSDTG